MFQQKGLLAAQQLIQIDIHPATTTIAAHFRHELSHLARQLIKWHRLEKYPTRSAQGGHKQIFTTKQKVLEAFDDLNVKG